MMMTEIKLLPPRPVKQVRTYQPTYQLNSKRRFQEDDVKKILKRIVDAELEEVEYSEKELPELILGLAETIRNAIKDENYNRYRILVTVTIGQRRQQSVQIFHSFLWDHERDGFAFYNYENPHIFANVTAYGVYLD
ncbi:dynein light chain Tctex-type 5-like isoform X2 [Plodia interpunctella]|uniref:dynein light chain Tctex-type 5-like isoform X2 n=1 Tax=Plodia interpunctella TaxID=58824 RepID=UPI00236787B0|nr:dynein light chain Tctex-type 5-like isoform X2 [Plodia interpunctella]